MPGQHSQPTPTLLGQGFVRVVLEPATCTFVRKTGVFYVPMRLHRVERTPNKSQHRKFTPGQKILPPLLLRLELTTFRSRVRRFTNEISRLPTELSSSSGVIRLLSGTLPLILTSVFPVVCFIFPCSQGTSSENHV